MIWLLTLAAKGYAIWFIAGIVLYPLRLWIFMWPHWFAFNAAAYLLAPVLPLLRVDALGWSDNNHFRRVEPRLPTWLNWFMTDDNSLCGDMGFVLANGESYWSMVKWLWRNPAVGFERSILAVSVAPTDRIRTIGNPKVSDAPHGLAGICFVMVGWHWNLVCVIPTAPGYCMKLDFGWQLKTYAEEPARLQSQPIARYAMTVRPTKFVTSAA